MKTVTVDLLTANVYDTRDEMGRAAAEAASKVICKLLETRDEINIIFAAAPSQNETLAYLAKDEKIDWSRINALHMDEYIGLAATAPQRFGNYLKEHIFSLVPFKSVNYITPDVSPEQAAADYSAILKKYAPDVVLMGIGENGHIAFNDPGVADFQDKEAVKVVELDDMCRMQQVNDGCFAAFDDVPKYALTLTIPTLFSAKHLICSVPAATKAQAVFDTLNDPVCEACPATIMRRHPSAQLFCDSDSASLLNL